MTTWANKHRQMQLELGGGFAPITVISPELYMYYELAIVHFII